MEDAADGMVYLRQENEQENGGILRGLHGPKQYEKYGQLRAKEWKYAAAAALPFIFGPTRQH